MHNQDRKNQVTFFELNTFIKKINNESIGIPKYLNHLKSHKFKDLTEVNVYIHYFHDNFFDNLNSFEDDINLILLNNKNNELYNIELIIFIYKNLIHFKELFIKLNKSVSSSSKLFDENTIPMSEILVMEEMYELSIILKKVNYSKTLNISFPKSKHFFSMFNPKNWN